MTRWTILYAFWCLLVIVGFAVSGSFGYSPFADGGRSASGHAFYGPQHK